jgi:aryl-alcohol dehydrogenase-like predicted oxidoreductase
MQKIRLGRSGLQVTKIGFGGIPIQRITEDEAVEVVRRAVDLGINWIDTANGYTVSEERIGKALREYPRGRVLLFTKGGGKSPEALDEQIQLSLRRLQTDVIDVYQFHGVHSEAWKGMLDNGAVDLVLDYRRRGVIRHVAASSHDEASLLEVIDHPAIEVVQRPFNFVMHGEAEKVLEKCPYDLPIREIMRAEVENYHRLRPPVSCRGKKRSLNSS